MIEYKDQWRIHDFMLGGAKIVPYEFFFLFYKKFAQNAKKIFSLPICDPSRENIPKVSKWLF